MKKVLYGILIFGAFLIPTQPQKLETLKPVEVIQLTKNGAMIRITTDITDTGEGRTVAEALIALKNSTAGTVYLDTTKYLLVTDETVELIDEMRPYLKYAVRMCISRGQVNLEKAAEFLRIHEPNLQLKDYRAGIGVQNLELYDGKMILKENVKK